MEPPIANFLEKYFNRDLEEGEREVILKDFPKPHCKVIVAPRLDDRVKKQLKKKGRDPNYGAEKSLFKIQEQLLDVVWPLSCLWADLLNKDAGVTPEDELLLVQSTSAGGQCFPQHHSRTQEDCLVAHQPQAEVTGFRRV